MNLKIATTVLRQLHHEASSASPQNRMRILIAARWVWANMTAEYDRLIRVQVLEGLAGVPVGNWSRSGGARGLAQAKRVFENQHDLDPAWLTPDNTGAYQVLAKATAKILQTTGLLGRLEPNDVINSAMTGLPLDPTEQTLRLRPAYELGKKDQNKGDILSGKINPQQVAASGLQKAMFNRVMDYQKHVRLEQNSLVDEEGESLEVPDNSGSVTDVEFFAHMLFKGTDPVSRKVQALMRQVWEPSGPMTLWLDVFTGQASQEDIKRIWIDRRLEQDKGEGSFDSFRTREQELEAEWAQAGIHLSPGSAPPAKAIADIFDIFPQDFSQKHWKVYWGRFLTALWKNTALRDAVSNLMEQNGIDAEMIDPEQIGMIVQRADRGGAKPKMASSKLAALYRLRACLEAFPGSYLSRFSSRQV